MSVKRAVTAASMTFGMLLTGSALAFDGWHTETVTMLPSKTSSYDYVSYDEGTRHLFIGHRREGLQVFDPGTHQLIKVMPGSEEHSSNGASLVPERDLGVVYNEDGTFIPFKLSTLELTGPVIKLASGIDASHYDPASKRLFFNVEPESGHTDVTAVDIETFKTVGTITVPTGKAEGAAADGAGRMYLAGQNEGKIFVLDTANLRIADTWSSPACAKPTMIQLDPALKRLFASCRSQGTTKAALVVVNTETGSTVWSTEIGDGTDSLIYDAATKRLFTANGVGANLNVIEMVSPDSFKVVETLGTVNNLKVLAMDHARQKLYSIVAEGSADTARKGNLSVSPFYINSIFANTFRVVTISR